MAFILLGAFAAVATVLYLHRLDAGHEFREDGAMLLAWTTATTRKVLAATRQAQSAWPEVRQSVSHQLGHLPETLGAIRFGAHEIGKPRSRTARPRRTSSKLWKRSWRTISPGERRSLD